MISKSLPRWTSLLFMVVLLLSGSPLLTLYGQLAKPKPRPVAAPPAKVKLVLGIVIDQFRYDYLTRFEDQFGAGGFKRLLQGAVFTNAHYPYTPTVTACGHSVFMTGAAPNESGIIANEWYDRETGKRVTSVSDPETKLVGGKDTTGASPHRMMSSALGDQLKIHTNGQAKVFGVSLKDRAAILPAGKKPNGAFWYDTSTGKIVSSTYYYNELPAWAQKFNQEQGTDTYFGKVWQKLLPEAAYSRSLPDDSPFEKWPFGKTFPHTINGGESTPGSKFYNQFEATPFANELVANFAKTAIENEKLGADDVPDLLTVSFSANDILGHYTGPNSPEAQDITLRTDRVLADLFNYIDKKIGLQNVVIAFTADHGAAPVPEHAQTYGIGGRIADKDVKDAIYKSLNQRYGSDEWITDARYGNIWLNYEAFARHKIANAEAEEIARAAVAQVPGIYECYTRSSIISGKLPSTKIAQSVALGFYAPRNGDLVIIPKPFWIPGDSAMATSHGSPYNYDTHVPVIFYGAGIKGGTFAKLSSPLDIAPTLAELLKIELPSNSIGTIQEEALKK